MSEYLSKFSESRTEIGRKHEIIHVYIGERRSAVMEVVKGPDFSHEEMLAHLIAQY